MKRAVLILGSGPSVLQCRSWPSHPFAEVVAINNAWAVRPDWTVHIHPEDFPASRRPVDVNSGQTIVTAQEYVPAQNTMGGFVYAGGTMAFTAAYWALQALRPDVLAFLGCDMVYPATGDTHFYGTGTADPLRVDISLRSLPAKARRLQAYAAGQSCALINLSSEESVLPYPRSTLAQIVAGVGLDPVQPNAEALQRANDLEQKADYFVPSGRYWLERDRFDPAVIDAIDAAWLNAYP